MSPVSAQPLNIILHTETRELEVSFDDGQTFRWSAEFLRVNSPSAEVRGHGPGQETLVTGKRQVAIKAVEPVGNYAVTLVFSDGHDSGIYSWDYLYEIGVGKDKLWRQYMKRLLEAGADREPAPDRWSG